MNISHLLAQYALSLSDRNITEEVLAEAKNHVADTLGCILAGSVDPVVTLATDFAHIYGGLAAATVFGSKVVCTDAATAAMINGIAGHVRDFDDMSSSMNGHPSVVVLPVALALAERLNASGAALLDAYVIGVEVMGVIGRSFNAALDEKEMNATTVLGVFGAAVAAGRLLGLSERQMADAIGIAAGEASGTKGNFGFAAKDITVGNTCAKGIFAAEMALRGVHANPAILNAPNGVFAPGTYGVDLSAMQQAISESVSTFVSPGIVIKPYPSCRGNHGAIDIFTELMQQYAFIHEQVVRIVCKGQSSVVETDRFPIPTTPAEGKFSIPYCLALVMLYGKLRMKDFIGDHIRQAEALAPLMQKVEVVPDRTFPNEAWFGLELEVHLSDGRLLRRRCDYAKGDPRRPLSADERKQKFTACARCAVDRDFAEPLYHSLMKLEYLPVTSLVQEIHQHTLADNR